MAKPKKEIAIVEEEIAAPKSDRYASQYPNWKAFVMAKVPADKYPTMHKNHLR